VPEPQHVPSERVISQYSRRVPTLRRAARTLEALKLNKEGVNPASAELVGGIIPMSFATTHSLSVLDIEQPATFP